MDLPWLAMISAAGSAAVSAGFTLAALRLQRVNLTDPTHLWRSHRKDDSEALDLAVIATTMSELPKLDTALGDKAWRIGMAQVFLAAALLCNVAVVVYEAWMEMAG